MTMEEDTIMGQIMGRLAMLRPVVATAAAAYGVTELQKMAAHATSLATEATIAAEHARELCREQAQRIEEQRATIATYEERLAVLRQGVDMAEQTMPWPTPDPLRRIRIVMIDGRDHTEICSWATVVDEPIVVSTDLIPGDAVLEIRVHDLDHL
jgi:hypothetical protein